MVSTNRSATATRTLLGIAALALCISWPLSADAAQPTLNVSTSYTSGQSLAARGASRVPMLAVHLEASCDAPITLQTLTLMHQGLGDSSDLQGVYAMRERRRLSPVATISRRERTVSLRFRRLTLAPCERTTLDIFADFSPDASAGSQHALVLRSADEVRTSDAVVNVMASTPRGTTSTATISQGTIGVSYLSLPRRLSYGSDRILLRLKLDADSESHHILRALTLTNDGKARDTDVQNLWLSTTRGERLTPIVEALDGEIVRLVFDEPLFLERNGDIILVLHGDLRASRTRTIDFRLEEPGDLEATPTRARPRQ